MQAVLLEGYSQINFAVSASPQQSPPLAPGVYDCWCDVDCWIAVGPNASTGLTSGTGYKIDLGQKIPVLVAKDGARIGAVAGGTGTFSYHKTGQ